MLSTSSIVYPDTGLSSVHSQAKQLLTMISDLFRLLMSGTSSMVRLKQSWKNEYSFFLKSLCFDIHSFHS